MGGERGVEVLFIDIQHLILRSSSRISAPAIKYTKLSVFSRHAKKKFIKNVS